MHNTNKISTYRESSLHASLKKYFSEPGDKFEQEVETYIIDIVRNNLLVEIQTKNFNSIEKKLNKLSQNHKILLVHPIIKNKWIVKKGLTNDENSRRRSPKKGRLEDIFVELVRASTLASNSNITIGIVMVNAEEVWVDDGKGSWRRKGWSIIDRNLLKIENYREFRDKSDYLSLLPKQLPQVFTNKELAEGLGISKRLASKMSYTMRKMNIIEEVGKQGRKLLFREVRI